MYWRLRTKLGGAIDSERQCFRQTATGVGQSHAERAHQAVGALSLAQEDIALARGDVFTSPAV